MADLSYTVAVSGHEDLPKLAAGIDAVAKALGPGKDIAEKLAAFKAAMGGMGGSLDGLKGLEGKLDSFKQTLSSKLDGLDKAVKDELKTIQSTVAASVGGISAEFEKIGKAAAAGLDKSEAAIKIAADRNLKLNAKYATDIETAVRQIQEKGTSSMLQSLQNRASNAQRILQSEAKDAVAIAQKAYGTDFVAAMQTGLQDKLSVLTNSHQATIRLLRTQHEQMIAEGRKAAEELAKVYADGIAAANNVAVGQAKLGPIKAQFKANSEAMQQELAKAAQEFSSSPETLRNMSMFYASQANIKQAVVDRARASANAQFKANSEAMQQELAKAAQEFSSSPETLRSMSMFYASQTNIKQAVVDRARASANAQFKANSEAMQQELAKAADAYAKSPQTLANMSKFYTLQASVKQSVADRARQEAREVFQARSKAIKEEAAKFSSASYGSAMSDLRSQYTNPTQMAGMEALRPAANANLGKQTTEVGKLSTAFQKLTVDGNDVHSMARGLASGFNLLWLTWGNLLPLFAGAAISNGFMKTAKEGLKVTQTLGTIAYLGENTAQEMRVLTDELVSMGKNGIYGPIAIAEAMQTLSLAGLKANEILAVTGTVMGFSVAGATDIKTAADVLVSVTTAFGTGAAGFSRSADIIMRAAADSKASVESFGEAMKTASVVGEQYGAKQEDVALLIQYLANLGIQGTAAGTAVRNMYADISGRSGPARKAMKELGLDFRDAEGHVIGLKEQTDQLVGVLSKYDGKSQANIIQAIYGERGAKAAIELLVKAKTYILENGKLTSQLEIDQRKLENAYGDAAIAAIKMGTTTQNAFKAAGATLETTLFGAFTAMEPQLYAVAVALREAFGSKDLQDTLSTLVGFVADIAKYVAENLEWITKLAVGYAGFRAAVALTNGVLGSSIGLLTNYTAAKVAAAGAEGALTAASIAATKATEAAKLAAAGRAAQAAAETATFLSSAARIIGVVSGIGSVVAIAAGLWSVYDMWASRSGSTMDDLSDQKSKDMIDALRKENDHLEAVNEARERGLSLLEAEALVKANNAKSDVAVGGIQKMSGIQSEIDSLQGQKNNAINLYGANAPGYVKDQINTWDLQLARKRVEMRQAGEESRKVQADLAQEEQRRSDNAIHVAVLNTAAREKEAAATKKLMDEYRKLYGTGSQTWEQSQGGANSRAQKPSSYDEQTLPNLQKQMDSELAVIKARFDSEKAIQDSEYKNLLVTQGQHQAKVLASTVTYEQESLASIEAHAADYVNAYVEQYAEIKKVRDGFKPDSENWKAEDAKLEALRNKATTDMQADEDKHVKIKLDSNKRQILAAQDLAGETRKLIKADEEYWTKSKLETDKIESMQKVAEQYRNINTSVFSNATALKAEAEAIAESKAQHEGQLQNMRKEIELRMDAIAALEAQIELEKESATYTGNNTVWQELSRAKGLNAEELAKLKARYSKSLEEGITDGAERGALAYQKEMDAKAAELTNALADAIETALTEGGAAGAKKLKAYLLKALIIDPIMVEIKASIQPMVGQMIGGGSGASGGGTSGGGGGGGLGNIGGLSNAYSAFAKSGVGQSLGLSNSGAYVGNNPSAYSPVGGSNLTSLGQAGAKAMGMVGDALAGYAMGSMFNSMISGGYSMGKGMDTFQKVGTVVGSAIGGPVVGAIIGAAAGALNRIFGRKLKDSGIQGEFGGSRGFEGESFEFYKGGLLRSDKTKTNPLAEEARKVLGDAFNLMRIQVGTFATSLGLNTAKIADFTTKIKVSTKGLSDADAEKAIQEALATANNELAEQVIGSWVSTTERVKRQIVEQMGHWDSSDPITRTIEEDVTTTSYTPSEFARDGEKAIDTLTRLATSLTTVNDIWKNLGFTLYEASLAGADAASTLVDAFGGLENFAAVTGVYYDNFYSEAEKTANVTRDVAAALADVGLQMPTTREEFRALVESQMALGDAGTDAVSALLGVSGAFASVTAASETAADAAARLADEQGKAAEEAARRAEEIARERYGLETQIMRLLGDTAGLRMREIEALDASNRALQEHIYAIEDAREAYQKSITAANDAYSGLERSVAAEKTALQAQYELKKKGFSDTLKVQADANSAQIEAARAAADKIRGIASALQNALKSSRVDSPSINAARLSSARSTISGAAESNNLFTPGLESALAVAGADNKQFYGRFEDYAYAQGVTAGEIAKLSTNAQAQLSAAESIVSSLAAQNSVAQLISDAEMAALDEWYAQELKKLDDTLTLGKSQLDAMLGIDNSVLSVADAVANLANAINASNAALQAQKAAEAAARAAMQGAGGGGGAGGPKVWRGQTYTDFMGNQVALQVGQSKQFHEAVAAAGTSAVGSLSELRDRLQAVGKSDIWDALSKDLTLSYQDVDKTGGRGVPSISASDGVILAAGYRSDNESMQDYATKISGWAQNNGVQGSTNNGYSQSDISNAISTTLGQGASVADILDAGTANFGLTEQEIRDAARAADIPGFATGINRVPHDMLARIHKDEAVVPAAYNPYNPGASAPGNSEVVAELRKLSERLDAIEANTRATAGHAAGTDRKLARVIQNDAIKTETTV